MNSTSKKMQKFEPLAFSIQNGHEHEHEQTTKNKAPWNGMVNKSRIVKYMTEFPCVCV